MQDHILNYLSNTMMLPFVMRCNKSILKYFVTYESNVSLLKFEGSQGLASLEKTKHGCWFLTEVLTKVIPNLECLDTCIEYLKDLGRKHRTQGVRREHLDLLALVYVSAVKEVMAAQGKQIIWLFLALFGSFWLFFTPLFYCLLCTVFLSEELGGFYFRQNSESLDAMTKVFYEES